MALSNRDLIEHYRKTQPGTLASDDLILSQFADRATRSGTLDQFPELSTYIKDQARANRPGIVSEATSQFGAGVDLAQAKLGGTAELIGDVAGVESLATAGRNLRRRNEAEAAEYGAPSVARFEDVDNVGDLGYWLTGVAAQSAPALAGTVAAATAGGIVGTAVAGPAGTIAGIGAGTLGSSLAAGAAGFTQMQNYGELRDQGVASGRAAAAATGAGLIGAALDAVLPTVLAGRISGSLIGDAAAEATAKAALGSVAKSAPRKALEAYGKMFVEGTLTEGATEFGQELASIGSEVWANQGNPEFKLDSDEIRSRLLNAAVGGGLLGGPIDVAAGAFERNVAGTPRAAAPTAIQEATARAPLGGPAEIARSREESSRAFRYGSGDIVNVKGAGNDIALFAAEVLDAQVDPATGRMVVTVADEAGNPVVVPQDQLEPFDPESPASKQRERQQAASRESALKQGLVTPEIEQVLIEAGLTPDELAAWTPEELLARYSEVRRQQPAPSRQPPTEAVYRDAAGAVTRGPVPEAGIQTNLFGVGEVNREFPASIQTAQDLQSWREGQIKARANANLARMRSDQDVAGDTGIGPVVPLNPAAADGLNFNTDGRQTLLSLSEDPLEADAERAIAQDVNEENAALRADVSRTEQSAMNQADLLADSGELRALLAARGTEPDVIARIIDALVQDQGGWENPQASLAGFIRSARAAAASAERERVRNEKALAAQNRREAELTTQLQERGASAEEAAVVIANMRGDAAKAPEILAAAFLEFRAREAAKFAAEDARSLAIAEGREPEVDAQRLALTHSRMAGLGPVAYAEAFTPVRLTEDDPQLERIVKKAAGRKAIAFVENGNVILRQILRGRAGQLTVARRQAGLSKADAFERIRGNLRSAGFDAELSDSTIGKILSENPEQSRNIRETTKRAVRAANQDVGYTSADNVPLLGEGGWLESHDVAGFITSASDKLDRSVVELRSLREFELFVSDLRDASINGNYAGADPDVVAQVSTSLDRKTEEGAAVSEAIADPNAASPQAELEAKEALEARVRREIANADTPLLAPSVDAEIVAQLSRFIARIRDAQIAARPERTAEMWAEDLRTDTSNKTSSQIFALLRDSETESDADLLEAIQAIDSPEVTLGTVRAAMKQAADIPVRARAARKAKAVTSDPVPYTAPATQTVAEFFRALSISPETIQALVGKVARLDRKPKEQLAAAKSLIAAAKKYYEQTGVEFPTEADDQVQTAMMVALSGLDGLRTLRSAGAAYRPSASEVAAKFDKAVQSANAMGVRVHKSQLQADHAQEFFRTLGGEYSPSIDLIRLVMSDLANPNRGDLLAIFHETMHSVVANAPAYVQDSLHAAFANLNPEVLAQRGNPEADVRLQSGVRPEGMSDYEWLEENFVEDRTLRFVDREYARSVFAYVWRTVREVYYRALAWLQNQTGMEVTPTTAVGLVEARFAKFAAGDYLSPFGADGLFTAVNGPARVTQKAKALVGQNAVQIDPKTGRVVFAQSLGDTEGEVRYNLSTPREEFIHDTEQSGYADLKSLGMLTARGGFSYGGNNIGNTLNEVNWSTLPVSGDAGTAPLARAGNMDRALGLLANRAELWPRTVTTEDGLNVRLLQPDTVQGGGVLGRLRHFVFGTNGYPATGGEAAAIQIARMRGTNRIADTLARPALIAKTGTNAQTYIARYNFNGRPETHAVVVANADTAFPYVLTQYVINYDSLNEDLNGVIIKTPAAAGVTQPQVLEGNRTPIGPQTPGSATPNLPGAERTQGFEDSAEAVKRTIREAVDAATSDYSAQAEIYKAREIAMARIKVAVDNTLHWRLVNAFNMAQAEGVSTGDFDTFSRALGVPNYLRLREVALAEVARSVGADHGVDRDLELDSLSIAGERDQAELLLAQRAAALDERVAKVEADARNLETASRDTYNETVKRLEESTAEIKSLAVARRNARDFVREQLDLLRRHARSENKLAGSEAALRQTIKDLEGGVEQDIYDAYAKVTSAVTLDEVALDRVLDVALEVRDGERFGAEMTPREFFEAIKRLAATRPELEVFFDASRPGRPSPLVAAVHRFLVKQEIITDNIRAAKLGADTQVRLVAGIKEIMSATTDRELSDLRQAALSNMDGLVARVFKTRDGREKLVFSRVLRAYFKALGQNVELKRSLDNATKVIEVAAVTRPALLELRRASEQRISAALNFELGDGVSVVVPSSATDTVTQLREPSRSKAYRSSTESPTTNREVVTWIQAQDEWLAARKNTPLAQDLMYNTIKLQRDKLVSHLQSEVIGDLKTGLASGYYQSMPALLRNSGTRDGSIAAARWVRYDDLQRKWTGQDRTHGKAWSEVGRKLAAKSGLERQTDVDSLFYQPMMHILNEVPVSEEDGFNLALAQVRLNPIAREALMRPGVVDAFKELFKRTLKDLDYLSTKLKEGDIKVEDDSVVSLGLDDETTPILRRQIERGVRTGPRQLSSTVSAVVSEMRGNLKDVSDLAGTDTASLAAALKNQGSTNPALDAALQLWNDLAVISPDRLEEVRVVLKKFFGGTAVGNFIKPLIMNFVSPTIPAPTINGVPGGVLPPEIAAAAWSKSNDDIVAFAEQVFDTLNPAGTRQEKSDYRAAIITYFGKQFAKLNNLADTQASLAVGSPLGAGHLAMDARIGKGFPVEWLDYMRLNESELRSSSNTIAISGAFGRDLRDLLRQYQTISQEVARWADEYNALRAVTGSDDRKTMLRRLREFGDASSRPVDNAEEWLKKRESALTAQNRLNFESLVKMSGGLLNPDDGLSKDFTLGMEIFDTVLAGLLASPKSAVKNLSSVIDLITLFRSPGFASLRALGTGSAAAMRQAIASGLSVFGIDAFKNSIMQRRLDLIGQLDPDRKLGWREITNETGFNNSLELTKSGRVQAKIRSLRNLLTNYTLNLSGSPRGEIRAVGFRLPTGIFTWSQHISNLAVAESIISEFERLTNRALDRASKDPSYLPGLRKGDLIEGEDVGYFKGVVLDDRPAFAALQDHARQMGKPLEQLVLEAADLQAQGQDIFTVDTISRIYSRAVTEVSLESSVVNNAVPVMGSNTGRVAFRLFRWSWAKQFKVFDMLKTPEGRRTFGSSLNGLAAIGLMMLPAGVLFSLMLEEYDEEVTGKATNVRPLGGSFENTLASLMERMTITGSFGFAGDATNTLLNSAGVQAGGAAGDGNIFSVDQRVVLLSSLGSLSNLVSRAQAQGWDNLTYATFYRQLAQVTGGGGALQYAQIINQLANGAGMDAPFDQEAKLVARINVSNQLRAAGRVLKFEGRAAGGASRSNEVTPWITDMSLAALTNDRQAFSVAYRKAIEEARDGGSTDPVAKVKQTFAGRHPLKGLFRANPTPGEVEQLLRVIGPEGATEVRAAIGSFNAYLSSLGLSPFNGVESERKVRPDTDLLEWRRNSVDNFQ